MAYACARPGDGGGEVQESFRLGGPLKPTSRRATPAPASTHRVAPNPEGKGPCLRPGGLDAPRPRTQPGPSACLCLLGRSTRQRHLEAVVLGPGEGALGHRNIRSAPGVDRRLQTPGRGGGGGVRGSLRFQTLMWGWSKSAPGPQTLGGRGRPGLRLESGGRGWAPDWRWGRGTRTPD